MNQPTLAVISGFLGAGKTTLCTNLIGYLWDKDINAALITNDQSTGLVDTEIAAAGGVNVKEISGGCFCCRCDEFALALDEIVALRESEIIIAEAVGSCTDLVATVVEPLRVDLQRPYRVLPVTVVVDPARAEAVLLGMRVGELGEALHEDVKYIFLKQLEEAQFILINKADGVAVERMDALVEAMEARFPEARVLRFSAQRAEDIRDFWALLQATESRHRPIQEIDYERYARGEAFLGWLNAECRVESLGQGLPATMDDLSDALGQEVHRRQVGRGVEIAHLKVSVVDAGDGVPSGGERELSVVQCVSSAAVPVPVRRCGNVVANGRVLINLRAQAEAAALEEDVRAAVAAVAERWEMKAEVVRLDSFAPGAPNPPYQRR